MGGVSQPHAWSYAKTSEQTKCASGASKGLKNGYYYPAAEAAIDHSAGRE